MGQTQSFVDGFVYHTPVSKPANPEGKYVHVPIHVCSHQDDNACTHVYMCECTHFMMQYTHFMMQTQTL